MKWTVIGVLLVAVLFPVVAWIAMAQEPCEGGGIEIRNADPCGLTKWIAVKDSATTCQILCVIENPEDPGEKCGINPSWIGGIVEADEEAEHGFNFDPETVEIAEIVAEALQTNTCQIAENPKDYSGNRWFIPADFRDN